MKYVWIDVHKKICQAAVIDEDGTPLDEIRLRNEAWDIEEFALKLSIFHDEVKAVVESTENLWIQIHDRLEEHGKDPRGKTLWAEAFRRKYSARHR